MHSAIESAGLTERQAEAIAWVYGVDITHEVASKIMGITRRAVGQFIDAAAERIAGVYERWDYGSVSVEVTEGVDTIDEEETAVI